MERAHASQVSGAPSAPGAGRLHALLGLMLLIWSANFIFAKLAFQTAPPLLVACLRTVLAGLLVTPLWLAAGPGPGVRPVAARDLPRLAALGVVGIVGNQLLFVLALGRTTVAHGSLLTATGPVMVLALGVWRGEERLTGRKLAGLAAAVAGVAVLQLGKEATGAPSLSGDLLMLGNASLFALFSVFGKRVISEHGALALNAAAFWGGGLLSLPWAAWGLWRVWPIGPLAWAGILYMAFSSIAGYLIYSYALRHLPASRVSSVTYLQPVVATLLAMVFLGEVPGVAFAVGGAAVLAGVWLAQRR